MLEKPTIPDQRIVDKLREAYGLRASELTFLPLGADVDTAVYRTAVPDGTAFFLKLRKGGFDEITTAVPLFLAEHGLKEIIAPLETRSGRSWADFSPYAMILYPFITGSDGYETPLTDRQWTAFGAALRAVHDARLPKELESRIPREDFSARWREEAAGFVEQVGHVAYADPVAARTAAFLRAMSGVVRRLIERGNRLARALREQPPKFVLCHSDIHAGNLLIAAQPAPSSNGLYIVDWDAPGYAPKERDLNLIGGCLTWGSERETALFYQSYHGAHPIEIDATALAYYRCERAIMDIAAFCEQLLLTSEGGDDREQSYRYFTSSFLPGAEIEIALRTGP